MVVHRLDMATSGVVVMARSDAALKSLHQQVRNEIELVGDVPNDSLLRGQL